MIDLNHSRTLAARPRAGCFLTMLMLAVFLTTSAPAQTFTVLHSFSGTGDGAHPYAGLILSGNTLYGTADHGGSGGNGTVFAVNTDGTGFTNLYSFAATDPSTGTNSDGANPTAGLILAGKTLYGTASSGGRYGNGTVFAVNTDGTAFTNLYSFTASSGPNYTNSDGATPTAGLILLGSTLYGTAAGGGSSGAGTVFAVDTNGVGFTNLYSFSAVISGTNIDGADLFSGLILSSNTLYGMAEFGGSEGSGTVFGVNIDGTAFTNLHNFNPAGIFGLVYHFEGLTLSGNTLYGVKAIDGNTGYGTVFRVNTDGSTFANLYSFTNISDGATPYGGLILSNNTLYGTAQSGGTYGGGTVFAINTDGTGFTNLFSFAATDPSTGTNSDGAGPQAGLISSRNALYGTAAGGGIWGNGTVFSLSFSPQLTIIPDGGDVVLVWPTNYAGFDYSGFTLQSTTNLASPVWTTNLPAPVVVSGRNTVTNPISGTQQFYRLSQ